MKIFLPVLLAMSVLISVSGCESVKPIAEPKFEVDRALFPYQSKYLNLSNGTRVHYVDEGKGPVLK